MWGKAVALPSYQLYDFVRQLAILYDFGRLTAVSEWRPAHTHMRVNRWIGSTIALHHMQCRIPRLWTMTLCTSALKSATNGPRSSLALA